MERRKYLFDIFINPLYTEQTFPHYILEESSFIFLEKNG